MEIKRREVIFSIVIIAVLLIVGFTISGRIRQNLLEKYQEYDSAIKIDKEELFLYGMRTNIGNSFVYGELKAVDSVTFSEIDGEYSYVKKEEQEYRRHSRTVTETYKDGNGKSHTRTKTEDYWTWDTMRTVEKHATRITFLNVEFAYEKIPFPSSNYLVTVSTGFHKRNQYYGTGMNFQGTIYTSLKDETIHQTSFYQDLTMDETLEYLESGHELIWFWVLWIILIVVVVVVFYYLENRWLD